jgi:serine/threonine-protein kinase
MRICPARHGTYADPAEVCPECGERLVVDRRGLAPVPGVRIERLVGRGGPHDSIWEAVRDDGASLALKVTEPDADAHERQRLVATGQLVAGVVHPNLAAVHAAGRTAEGDAWVLMDLLRGGTLRQVLERKRHLTPPLALHVARGVLAGLSALHGEGIAHRDVKPGNIHLTARGRGAPWDVKLLDFSLARRFRPGDVPDRLDLAAAPGSQGPLVGTPEYMAPEQVLGHRADARADLYALAIVLHRALTGRLPFDAEGRAALLAAQLHDPPPTLVLPDGFPAPPGLALVLARALDKQPSDRHRTALDLLHALDALP